ncbi:MAG: hypothetical protein KDE27_12665 [Planctomycetes bacterium]|nr:hypothetical protein [Planctomycetota bacterium]
MTPPEPGSARETVRFVTVVLVPTLIGLATGYLVPVHGFGADPGAAAMIAMALSAFGMLFGVLLAVRLQAGR